MNFPTIATSLMLCHAALGALPSRQNESGNKPAEAHGIVERIRFGDLAKDSEETLAFRDGTTLWIVSLASEADIAASVERLRRVGMNTSREEYAIFRVTHGCVYIRDAPAEFSMFKSVGIAGGTTYFMVTGDRSQMLELCRASDPSNELPRRLGMLRKVSKAELAPVLEAVRQTRGQKSRQR